MTLTLRYMQPSDVSQVVKIDAASFDPPWTARSYKYEINESTCSFMLVLEESADTADLDSNGWRRWLRSLRGENGHLSDTGLIVGYAGLWNIQEEAHISTIATHPRFRGRGYGEILLAGMFGRSIEVGADYIVLEVRVSNRVAQNLYLKYGFQTIGTKRAYYRSNNEDAFDMRATLGDEEIVKNFYAHYDALQERIGFLDQYSEIPHPRLGR